MSPPSDKIQFIRDALLSISKNSFEEHSNDIKHSLFTSLYWIAGLEGQHTFNNLPPETRARLPHDWNELFDLKNNRVNGEIFKALNSSSASHAGRNCGRKFNVGEPIYRCIDCGFDNTCVLCVRCFNTADHSGHQVSVNICSDRNSGICDCGDPEAWTRELHCKCNAEESSSTNDENIYNDDYKNFLKGIFSVCLDFVLKVMASQSQTLYSAKTLRTYEFLKEDVQNIAKLFGDEDPEKDSESEFYTILWNDEYHDFTEARNAIITIGGCNLRLAKDIAMQIDGNGRGLVLKSKSLVRVSDHMNDVLQTNFAVSVISNIHYNRQEISKLLIDWLLSMTRSSNTQLQTISRRALCESLCDHYEIPIEDVPPAISSLSNSRYNGQLSGNLIPKSTTVGISSLGVHDVYSSRLQYLLFFDIRFWKDIRGAVHDLIVSTLVSDLEYKKVAATQIVNVYPQIIENFYELEREPLVSVLDPLSVQFFTCPTNSSTIVSTDLLMNVLGSVSSLFEKFMTRNGEGRLVFTVPKRSEDLSTAKALSFRKTFHDLNFIFEKAESLKNLYTPEMFPYFSKIIESFNFLWQLKRKVGNHVLNEKMDYIQYYDIFFLVSEVIYNATSRSKLRNLDNLVPNCISSMASLFSSYGSENFKKFKDYQLIDFKVSSDSVGFLHASHILLQRMLAAAGTSSEKLTSILETSYNDFLQVADIPLRSIVLNAQIESQFWVRNGLAVQRQSEIYKGQLHYKADVFLYQVALLTTDPERALLNVIDRFELLEWFSNNQSLEKTIYEEKVEIIVEQLISFLYVLLASRADFVQVDNEDERKKLLMKEELKLAVFAAPITFSQLEETCPIDQYNTQDFEEVFSQLTIFSAPKGLNDEGRYSLKPEYLKQVDPMLTSELDFMDSVSIISKGLAPKSKEPSDIIIEPRLQKIPNFTNLGDFTRTISFAKLISKLLSFCIEKKTESFVPHVLHLLHAAIKDDELVNGKEHFIECFKQIPISEHLFSIAVLSSFSKYTKSVADHLLEKLIVKTDSTVIEDLLLCFGEEEVTKYKDQKKKKGVDFDETEEQRKRRLAKERQKKILAKMSKRQQKFIDENDTSKTDGDDEEATTSVEEDTKHCVLCQGTESLTDILCAPFASTESGIFRKVPPTNRFFIDRAFKDWGDDSIENNLNAEGLGLTPDYRHYSYVSHSGFVGHSCNHMIHWTCLHTYMEDNNLNKMAFQCPLCKTSHDRYLPVIPLRGLSDYTLFYVPDIETDDTFPFGEFSAHLFENIMIPLGVGGLNQFESIIRDNTKGKNYYGQAKHIGDIFANTISQAEIATRINGNDAYQKLLDQIPEQKYKLLRTLFQYYLCLLTETPQFSKKKYISDIKKSLRIDDFMGTFVYLLGWGTYYYVDLCESVIKYYSEKYIRAILNNTYSFGEYAVSSSYNAKILSSEKLVPYRNLLKLRKGANVGPIKEHIKRFNTDDSFASRVVFLYKRLILNDVRKLAIIRKVLIPSFKINTLDSVSDKTDYIDQILSSLGLNYLETILSKHGNEEIFKWASVEMENGLPYPGVIKLVDLPKQLDYFTTSSADQERFPPDEEVENSENRIDFAVCLACGHKIFEKGRNNKEHLISHLHQPYCTNKDGVFLNPNNCLVILVALKGSNRVLTKTLNAPYMNSHGQSGFKATQNGHVASLQPERYHYLNNMWLSGDIYPYLSRHTSGVPTNGIEARLFQQLVDSGLITTNPEGNDNRNLILEMLQQQTAGNLLANDFFGEESEADEDEDDFPFDEDEDEDEYEDDDDVDEEFYDSFDHGFDNDNHMWDDADDGEWDEDYTRAFDGPVLDSDGEMADDYSEESEVLFHPYDSDELDEGEDENESRNEEIDDDDRFLINANTFDMLMGGLFGARATANQVRSDSESDGDSVSVD